MMKELVLINILSAVIAAKWSMDLKFNQTRQMIFAVGGLLLGPIMLVVLYVFFLQKAKKEGDPSSEWF